MARVRLAVSSVIFFVGIICLDGLKVDVSGTKRPPHACRMSPCIRKGCSEADKTDSCCNAQMFEMLRDVSNFLKAGNHTHALMFGSLLGAVRSHGIIPHTADVDLYVDNEGTSALLSQTTIPYRFYSADRNRNLVRGCPWDENASSDRHLRQDGKIASPEHDDGKWPFFYMDLYSKANLLNKWKKKEKRQTKKQKGNFVSCNASQKLHMITDHATIYGHQFPVMARSEECLHQWFGDFMKPKADKHNDEIAF